jgi:hypothetical protein
MVGGVSYWRGKSVPPLTSTAVPLERLGEPTFLALLVSPWV